jgi:diguanylate cyclase (GGDEF)-like protein
MPRTLRSQVQGLSVLPILGLTAVAILVSVILTHQQVDAEASRNLQEVTRLLATTTRARSESLAAQTGLMSDSVTVRNAVHDRDVAALRERAVSFVRRSGASAFIVADAKGVILARAGKTNVERFDPQLQGLIGRARGGDAASEIVAQGGKLYSAAVTPVHRDNKLIGTLAALSPVGADLAKDLKATTSADVVFIAKGKVVGSTLPLTQLVIAKQNDAWRVNVSGTSYVALATNLPNGDLKLDGALVALRSYDDLARPYRAFSTSFVVLLLGALMVAALLARAFARGLAKPMDDLVHAAQAVRDGSWPEPLQVRRDDELGLLISVFNDMNAALKKSQERMLNLVDTDPLTELDNHRRFKERLDQEVFRACMSNKPLVLCLVDLDKFADYNGEHGHAAGDAALRMTAKLLNEVAPDIAFLARYGGEEFAMLLPLTTLESAEAVLQRLQELAKGKFQSSLTFSAGLAEVTPGITTGSGLLLSAEMALSRGKQLGRDRICRFDAVPGASSADDPFQLQKFLQDTTLATIQTLAGAVDAKDAYTQGHSVRVARLASDLARYMGYPAAYVDLVYKTGTLHDVGKIGVPDSILSKPARLDNEEQAIMETHPVLGELIVRKAPQLEGMLPGVRHHHERWDGKGYPDRLMGQQIPLLARFIAIADTFDAMTSDRPYRRALPDDTALDEIKRKAGEQFDPELAESFVRMMRLNSHGMRAA